MRRDDDNRARREERLDRCLREGRSGPRLGTVADLVDEDERARARATQGLEQRAQVSGKRRKIVGDRLFVADDARDVIEGPDFGSGTRRKRNTRIGKQAEQANRLEHDRLAAHVRAGDDDGVRVVADVDVERHCLTPQQGMASLHDANAAHVDELRPQCVMVVRPTPARTDRVERCD